MSPPGRDEFRAVMGRFATGVTIVTTRLGDELHGMTANAGSAASLDPPLVLVCIDRSAQRRDGVPHHARATGAPIVDGSLAYLDCRIVGRYPGGDHTIFVGEVVDAGRVDGGGPRGFL